MIEEKINADANNIHKKKKQYNLLSRFENLTQIPAYKITDHNSDISIHN
jgi:hypothetical protein